MPRAGLNMAGTCEPPSQPKQQTHSWNSAKPLFRPCFPFRWVWPRRCRASRTAESASIGRARRCAAPVQRQYDQGRADQRRGRPRAVPAVRCAERPRPARSGSARAIAPETRRHGPQEGRAKQPHDAQEEPWRSPPPAQRPVRAADGAGPGRQGAGLCHGLNRHRPLRPPRHVRAPARLVAARCSVLLLRGTARPNARIRRVPGDVCCSAGTVRSPARVARVRASAEPAYRFGR